MLVVRVVEAEMLQQARGTGVVRMMAGEQRRGAARIERVADHRLRGFAGQALAPMRRQEMEADLEDAMLGPARAQAAAADEGFRRGQENGPLLHA